ncbi:hypothetical protein HCA58_02890 [Micromonospora sp. HNM0581]|uniref:SAM-dependent methyltransferase n=1 Tax=Micromonospora sp. HNM0581 TaxID=2716341 RepID=UPI00146C8271|nr:SAM-dependent methyltransferase [Micromonospora sp. HNM0581]NLU77353.1 hypothetical protein [Micromonospora sp. HNM0581]
MTIRWREAMRQALYGPGGFFVSGAGPAAHFRTSVHASPIFATALIRLIHQLDAALNFPDRFDVVDVGAGQGELVRALSAAVHGEPSPSMRTPLARRVRFTAVELSPRPAGLPDQIAWTNEIPTAVTGLLLATEWLDNVPLDLATHIDGSWHYLLVDPTTGAETAGSRVDRADADWLTNWWPAPDHDLATPTVPSRSAPSGASMDVSLLWPRAEIGRTRDEAWSRAVDHVGRGLALAVDYGHLRAERPVAGTLVGYRGGRQVSPVPDASCDVTAHVAIDSVAAAGERAARCAYLLTSQREALHALGADGGRPGLSLASSDPAGYLRALATAAAAAELTDTTGLGGHWWLWQPVGLPTDRLPVGQSSPHVQRSPG